MPPNIPTVFILLCWEDDRTGPIVQRNLGLAIWSMQAINKQQKQPLSLSEEKPPDFVAIIWCFGASFFMVFDIDLHQQK